MKKLKLPVQVINWQDKYRVTIVSLKYDIEILSQKNQQLGIFSHLQELRPINEENNLNAKGPDEGTLPSMCFKHGVLSADGVDKAARIIFPSIFCLFNIIYWIYYTQPVVYVDVE